MSFENLFFTIRLEHILYMEYLFGYVYGKTHKAQLSSKTGTQKLFFIWIIDWFKINAHINTHFH